MVMITTDEMKKKAVQELASRAVEETEDRAMADRLRAADINDIDVWTTEVGAPIYLPNGRLGIWAMNLVQIKTEPGNKATLVLPNEDCWAIIESEHNGNRRFLIVTAYIKLDDE